MPLFACAKCGCVENTALGLWWGRASSHSTYTWPDELKPFIGKGLCSECAPTHYSNGKPTDYGTWHGKFEKEHYSQVDYKHELLQLPS